MSVESAIEVPQRTRAASFADRLARRSSDASLALCVGVDPSPAALELLDGVDLGARGGAGRATRAAAIERFAGLVVESARDHAVAIKPQVAWYEHAGAPGMRALERTIEFARTAGLLVVLDAKRGDVPHSAAAYADAWLGDEAAGGAGVDALTVNAAVGADALEAMARIAADRHAALYALLLTSNPGAGTLQHAELADGRAWWQLLADDLARVDAELGGGIAGAVVGATRPELLAAARTAIPTSPLLVPGVGAQGGSVDELGGLLEQAPHAPTTLVAAARSLLPDDPSSTGAFRHAVTRAAEQLASQLSAAGKRGPVR